MIDGSKERNNCQLAFELQNLHVCEKCSNDFSYSVLLKFQISYGIEAGFFFYII